MPLAEILADAMSHEKQLLDHGESVAHIVDYWLYRFNDLEHEEFEWDDAEIDWPYQGEAAFYGDNYHANY